MNILLTGATGALGAELLQTLAEARPRDSIYVLLRASSPDELRNRSKELGAVSDSVVPVAGDVARYDLGLGPGYSELAERVGEIYHAAACTRLNQAYDHAERHNVLGTRNVLEFARTSQHLGGPGRFHHISTAYVAGRRTGSIREQELDCGQDFFNCYEWSKFETERALRRAATKLPVTIYRPGVLIGHSKTGRVRRFTGIYQVLRRIERGLVKTLPCRNDFLLDVLPVDYAARAIVRLAALPASIGNTFHITSGAPNRQPIAEFIETFFGRRPAGLRFCERASYSAQMRHYLPYLTSEKCFDVTNARSLLTGLEVPSWHEYVRSAGRFAFQSRSQGRATLAGCFPPPNWLEMTPAQSARRVIPQTEL